MSGPAAILSAMGYDLELAGRMRAALSFEPDVTEKRMFGGCAFLLAGNMLGAASGRGGLMLRVDPAVGAGLLDGEQVRRFEMNGRELDGWLHIDETLVETEAGLREWLGHALAFVRTLPAK